MQVRAQQYRSPGQLELTITALELESAEARDTGLGRTPFVEQVRGDIHTSDKKGRKNNIINCYVQCLCPAGYTGLSCETCAPGYEREAGGTCRRPVTTCPPGYYADTRAGGGECRVCPCPLTTPSNQFTRDCFLDVDSQVGVQATCPGHVSRPRVTCLARSRAAVRRATRAAGAGSATRASSATPPSQGVPAPGVSVCV